MANKAIDQIKEESGKLSLTDINHLMYATASAVTESLGMKTKEKSRLRKPNQPKWEKKIESEICKIRGDISALNEIKNKKSVKEKLKKALFNKYNIKQEKQIPTIIETLKRQLQAKTQRIRRFQRRRNFFHQNKLYRENAKKFYRELGKKSIEINETPIIDEVESFWGNIWEKQKSYNKNATWLN